MIKTLYNDLNSFKERMKKKSKKSFREYIIKKANQYHLKAEVYPKSKWAKNIVIGDIKTAKVIIGAHYDTPPRLPSFLANHLILFNILLGVFIIGLPFILSGVVPSSWVLPSFYSVIGLLFAYLLGFIAFPNKHNANDNTSGVLSVLTLAFFYPRDDVAYVLFDNEEKGLIGSISLSRALRGMHKKVIILDCVGRGEHYCFYHYKKPHFAESVMRSFMQIDDAAFSTSLNRGGYLMTSDHLSFQAHDHVGILCFIKHKKKKKMRNIHSHLDKTINFDNIQYICDGINNYLEEQYGNN